MAKPFSLQAVLEIMQERTDAATRQLARLIAAERDAQSRLDMLRQYRDDYAERFRAAAQGGLGPREWRNYQEFLGRLDEAISQQTAAVAATQRHTAAGQAHWQEQRTRLKAIDTLSIRHRQQAQAAENRQEQKFSDEFAARGRTLRDPE